MFAEKNLPFEAALDQGITRMNNRSFRKWSEMEEWYKQASTTELKNFNLSRGGFLDNDWDRARDIVGTRRRADMPVEVPYMYCSDYEVGANLMCNRTTRAPTSTR